MPFKTWVIGEEVLAADFNTYVQSQVAAVFPNTSTRDSDWVGPPNGALAVTTDTYSVWLRRAGAWVLLQTPPIRTGCSLTVNNQSIATGAQANLIWANEVYDTDNFHAPNATVVQVPAGLGGVYAVSVQVDANGTLNGACNVQVMWTGALPIISVIPAANRYMHVAGQIEVAAGVGFNVAVFNGHSGAVAFSARLNLARISV